jgi:hypothetical protein
MIRAARVVAKSQNEMADLIGMSHGKSVNYWIKKLDLQPFGRAQKWKPEEIEAIKADFQNGETLADIATTRNATRNQIAGLLHRAGAFKKGNERGGKAPRERKAKNIFPIVPKFRKEKIKIRIAPVIPMHIAFLDLQPDDCRQPYGDDPRTMTFCGHTKSVGAYCAMHAAINYRKPDERNRNPRPR